MTFSILPQKLENILKSKQNNVHHFFMYQLVCKYIPLLGCLKCKFLKFSWFQTHFDGMTTKDKTIKFEKIYIISLAAPVSGCRYHVCPVAVILSCFTEMLEYKRVTVMKTCSFPTTISQNVWVEKKTAYNVYVVCFLSYPSYTDNICIQKNVVT